MEIEEDTVYVTRGGWRAKVIRRDDYIRRMLFVEHEGGETVLHRLSGEALARSDKYALVSLWRGQPSPYESRALYRRATEPDDPAERLGLYDNTTAFALMSEEAQEIIRGTPPEDCFVRGLTGWLRTMTPRRGEYLTYRLKRPKPEHEPMTVPWHCLTGEWQWAAADENGKVWAFAREPFVSGRVWTAYGKVRHIDDLLPGFRRGTVPWDQSRVKRPEEDQ